MNRHHLSFLRIFGPVAVLILGGAGLYAAVEPAHGSLVWAIGLMLLLVFGLGAWRMVKTAAQERETERRFRAIFDYAMVGMASTSPEKGWLAVNAALCAILGYTQEELLSKTWVELTHPDDLAADVSQFEALLRGELDGYTLEKRFLRKDGQVVDTFLAVRAVRRPNGSLDFCSAIVEDISERRQAERARDESARTLQRFIDNLPGVAYVKDAELRITVASQGFVRLFGMNPGDMIGHRTEEFFRGEFGAKVAEDDRRVLASGQMTIIEEEFADRHFETTKFVLPRDHGAPDLAGVSVEVTQRVLADRHLETQVRRSAVLLEMSQKADELTEQAFMKYALEAAERLTDSGIGFIHFVNDDGESIELVAWSQNGLDPYRTAAHDNHYPLKQAGIWADAARQRVPIMLNDYATEVDERGLPEGHSPLARLISVPVIEGEHVRMMTGVGNKATPYTPIDVETVQLIGNETWRIVRRRRADEALLRATQELAANLDRQRELNKRLEEAHNQLLQSEKMASIGQLAAGVAHELNNPIGFVHSNLGTLDGYLHDLMAVIDAYDKVVSLSAECGQQMVSVSHVKQERDFDFLKKDIFNLIAESKDGLGRVRAIVQDLKSFSRVGEQEWKEANLHQGIDSTLNIVWNELKYKCRIVKEYGDIPPVYCLISQINQVFMNLLMNASQAIEKQGTITIRTSRHRDDQVCIEVVDTGRGIAQEHLNRIFEPFFTTKPVGKGTGLGLSLSYSIVERHHGRIEVDSQPGQGATFRVVLPIHPATAAAEAIKSESSS